MARFKFRRSLRFDNLEGRQMLSSAAAGGPSDQQQYLLQLINEARTSPAAAAAQISNEITPQVSATLQYYSVNLPTALQHDLLGHAAAPARLERRSGERRPGPKPVYGRQPDPDSHRCRRLVSSRQDDRGRLLEHHFKC